MNQVYKKQIVIIFSGAGGRRFFFREISHYFRILDYRVIEFNSLRYFLFKKRSPELLARHVNLILNREIDKAPFDEIIFVGYSQGADVLPFAINRLEKHWQQKISALILIGAAEKADFRLRLRDLITGGYGSDSLNIEPELAKLGTIPTLFIYGDRDRKTIARKARGEHFYFSEIASGHIFHDAKTVAKIILRHLQSCLQ